ncbi:MAG: SDR family oxidoreductase [Burkholderiaceae bacterium]|nr:SDR family oxidoreductase [Burkholderiaceae bacterium]
MKLNDRTVVITGAASGIGRALAMRFAAERPRGLVLADLPRQHDALGALVESIQSSQAGTPGVEALAMTADVGVEGDVRALIAAGEKRFGQVDVVCSNAGLIRDGDEHTTDADWQLNWQVHVMAHVYAARAAVPGMRARGEGYLLNTASAAGLLTSLPSATYAVTKHAAIALAEWLSVQHGNHGIKVSVLCPQAVDTPMIQGRAGASAAANDGVISAEALAQCVVDGMDAEHFLILPHPQVGEYFQRKGQDYDRWLNGMRRFASRLGIENEATRARGPK